MKGVEKLWVISKVKKYLDFIEKKAKNEEKEKQDNGGFVSRASKLKMRFYEACFLDEFRDDLIRMYDSKNRQQLDARNSSRRELTFFEKAVNKCNDERWIPHSTVFAEFHHEFSTSFPLPLYRTDGKSEKREVKLTVDKGKEWF